jgi:hypothetical protein
MQGRTSWNKGKTKKTDKRIAAAAKKLSAAAKGKIAWNKGKSSAHRGKTYEEIYGAEKAQHMKEVRSRTAWINDGVQNKKIKLDQLEEYIHQGWFRGRIMPQRS